MNVAKQVRRKAMSNRVAALVQEFAWALAAAAVWSKLTRRERRAVVDVAAAEERANKAYNRAAKLLEHRAAR